LLLLDGAAHDGNEQIVFYSRGLGAVSGIRKYTAGGFAYGIKEEIEDVYINIASNYVPSEEPGKSDKIYLYGFSRGAVIARVVAGLISKMFERLLFTAMLLGVSHVPSIRDTRCFTSISKLEGQHQVARIR